MSYGWKFFKCYLYISICWNKWMFYVTLDFTFSPLCLVEQWCLKIFVYWLQLLTDRHTNIYVRYLLNQYTWYILPIANPDGYIYTWTTVWHTDIGQNKILVYIKLCRKIGPSSCNIFFLDKWGYVNLT